MNGFFDSLNTAWLDHHELITLFLPLVGVLMLLCFILGLALSRIAHL